jgi:hypothetical protein
MPENKWTESPSVHTHHYAYLPVKTIAPMNRGVKGSRIKANIESQMESYLDGGDKRQMVVLFHDVQSVIAYNLVELIEKIEEVAEAEGYTPNFHLSKSEMEMTLRAQSDEN